MIKTSPRINNLNNKKIVFFDNSKSNADVLLRLIKKRLEEKFKCKSIFLRKKNAGMLIEPENLAKIKKCDAVILAIADCGSCSTWLMNDLIEIEKSGIPCVAIASDIFYNLAVAILEANNAPSLPLVEIKHPIAGLKKSELDKKVSSVVNDIILALTTKKFIKNKSSNQKNINGYSVDGLPIIKKTKGEVIKILNTVNIEKDRIIAKLPPCLKQATVKEIAEISIKAGCRTDYFPVVLNIIDLIANKKEFNLIGITATTHPVQPLVILNGPIRKCLNVNCSTNCFGPGNRANATIGRAITLNLMELGGMIPGQTDMATHGQPSKYSYFIGENEEDNPFKTTLAQDLGFNKNDDVITAIGAENPININDHRSTTGKDLLQIIATAMTNIGANNATVQGPYLIILGPEHAKTIKNYGWTKEKIKQFLFKKARIKKATIEKAGGLEPEHKNWKNLKSNTMLPVVKSSEDIYICIAGGPGKHSLVIPSFGWTKVVSKKIEWNSMDACNLN